MISTFFQNAFFNHIVATTVSDHPSLYSPVGVPISRPVVFVERLWQTFSSPSQSPCSLTPVANGTEHAHAAFLKPRGKKENSFSETKVEKRGHDLQRDSDSDDDTENSHGNALGKNLPILSSRD